MAANWFRTVELEPGLVRIDEPAVHPFFQANFYRITGRDFDIQLDFGVGVASLSAHLPDLSPAGKPVLAIATHAHVDHVGSFHEFADRAGHAAEATTFATMDDAGTVASWFAGREDGLSRLPEPGFVLNDFSLKPAPLTRLLAEGDMVDTGDRLFRVLHLPGHSPGSVGLLDEKDGTFFAGDAIYDSGLVDDIPGADIETYLTTMRRLADLDVRIVHAGHDGSFDRTKLREIALGYIESKATARPQP